jgi:hypothetical protein
MSKAPTKKPVAKKIAAKKPVTKKATSVRTAKKSPNPQQVRKVGKHPALAAPYGIKKNAFVVGVAQQPITAGAAVVVDPETRAVTLAHPTGNEPAMERNKKATQAYNYLSRIEEDIRYIRTNMHHVVRGVSEKAILDSLPPTKRDLLGDEPTFNTAVFAECLRNLEEENRRVQFDSAAYSAAVIRCQKEKLDVRSMLMTAEASYMEIENIERLISYLFTLCHIKRANRFGPEMNMGSAQPLPADAPVDNTEAASSK